MKKITLFGKEFYIFSESEREKLLHSFCGVYAGLMNAHGNADWLKKKFVNGHTIDLTDELQFRGVSQSIEYACNDLLKLESDLGF